MRILVTGGAGYIGSHVLVELLLAGHEVVVVDDLSSGYRQAMERAEQLAGRSSIFMEGTIGDRGLLAEALKGVHAVIHFAAFKRVDESMARPDWYFRNNVGGMATLLEAMEDAGVRRIVYSSSSAVYGTQRQMPIQEQVHLQPDSPYGVSKVMGEEMLSWMAERLGWAAVSLRYFNPVGAHASGQMGQPFAEAASLVPRALRTLTIPGSKLTIFGTDYDTPDGTCLRDYVHITDLAQAHLAALTLLDRPGHHRYNVGTGRPYSVREVLETCNRVTGKIVPAVEGARRPGDIPCAVADPSHFERETGFSAKLGLEEMVASAWNWFLQNPGGYNNG